MKLTIVALCCLISSTAFAQTFALDLEHFEPVGAPQKNILNVHQSKVLKNEQFSLSSLLHFSTNTLSVGFDSGEQQPWIEDQLSANLSASLGFLDFFELGFSLPLVLNRTVNPEIEMPENSKHTYLSDTRLVGKVQLPLNSVLGDIGVAMVSTLFLPTGDENYLSGLGIPRVEPRLVVDFRTEGGHVFAVNLAGQTYEKQSSKDLVDKGNIKLAVGALFQLTEMLAILATYSARFGNQTTGSEADGAIHFTPDGWGVIMGIGMGMTSAPGIPDYRGMVGVNYTNHKPNNDSDGDNIIDDKCPRQPEDLDGFEDDDGCPEDDNDADGLVDGIDKCDNKAEDFDGFEDEDGCPDLDNDKDGVLDSDDDCPLVNGNLKNAGCPLDSNFPIPEPSTKTDQDPK